MSPKDVLPVHDGHRLAAPGTKKLPSTHSILISVSLILLLLRHFTSPDHGILDLLSNELTRQTAPSNNPILLIKARKGAVASQNKFCSEIGVNVLKGGGNAVDAAVSAVLCIGVVGMYSSVRLYIICYTS
jgi:gamma-glutamyltranspeptidase/glutathione hydrolase/leukotriene-C4 hydrolase